MTYPETDIFKKKITKYCLILLFAYALSEFPGRTVIELENKPYGTTTLSYQIAVNLMVTGWIFGVYACIMMARTCEQALIKSHIATEEPMNKSLAHGGEVY